jgi:murein L,D-transpeptidase YafK
MKKSLTKLGKIRIIVVFLVLALVILLFIFKPFVKRLLFVDTFILKLRGEQTVNDVITKYGNRVDALFIDGFKSKNINYPPEKLVFLCFKKELNLELYAESGDGFKHIESYPVLVSSGKLGPKLREGDGQIPEGVYTIEYLNPNSSFHLSMKLNYPNEFDKEKAQEDGRTQPGTNIFIHGEKASIGCISIGNIAIEELFVIAARTGFTNIKVLIFPYDFRDKGHVEIEKVKKNNPQIPDWTQTLYRDLELEYERLRLNK